MTKNGVPFDTAHQLVGFVLADYELDALALGYSIVFGELEGGKFDWTRMAWEKKS